MNTTHKSAHIFVYMLSIAIVAAVSGQDLPSTPQTPEQVIERAKMELLEILENNGLRYSALDPAAVKRATPGNLIEKITVQFDSLVQSEDLVLVAEQSDHQLFMVPLEADGRIVTVMILRKESESWNVLGTEDTYITEQLNLVKGEAEKLGEGDFYMYDVPNLSARVYGFRSGAGEWYFTNYGDFSLDTPVSALEFLPFLQQDARRFHEKYKDLIERGKYVN